MKQKKTVAAKIHKSTAKSWSRFIFFNSHDMFEQHWIITCMQIYANASQPKKIKNKKYAAAAAANSEICIHANELGRPAEAGGLRANH